MLFQNKSFIKKLPSKLGEYNKYSFLPANKQTDNILTNIIPLGGTMKKLAILIVAVLFLGLTGVLMADVSDPVDETVTGTVPFNASWTFTAVGGNATAFDSVLTAIYNADSLTIAGVQVCSTFNANDSVWVDAKIKSPGWSVPDDYPTGENKKSYDANSDFKIKVSAHHDSLDAQGTFDNETLLTDTDQHILMNITDGGLETTTSFTLDAAILWDWWVDIAGEYSITMTLTINQIVDGS